MQEEYSHWVGSYVQATRSAALLQHESALGRYLMLLKAKERGQDDFSRSVSISLGFGTVRWYTKTSR